MRRIYGKIYAAYTLILYYTHKAKKTNTDIQKTIRQVVIIPYIMILHSHIL